MLYTNISACNTSTTDGQSNVATIVEERTPIKTRAISKNSIHLFKQYFVIIDRISVFASSTTLNEIHDAINYCPHYLSLHLKCCLMFNRDIEYQNFTYICITWTSTSLNERRYKPSHLATCMFVVESSKILNLYTTVFILQ